MTWVSANSQYYFKPALLNDNVYISGDNIAISPALYSFFHATDIMGKDPKDIRLVSVGSLRVENSKIDQSASSISWAERLRGINSEVDKDTSDYMTKHIFERYNNTFHKFENQITKQQDNDLYFKNKRGPTVK